MKFKNVCAVIISALLAVGATACGVGNPDDDNTVDNSNANFIINGNTATLRWDKYDGANGYSIEKASSRYGNYEYLDYVDGASVAEYVTGDVTAYYRVTAFTASGERVIGTYSYETELFGNNTYIYAPTDDAEKIQEDFDAFYKMTFDESNGVARGEFRSDRFAALFKAGSYDVSADVGYYTAIYGLGQTPSAVELSGMNVTSPVSLCNFWRTAENLAIKNNVTWAVSQATSLRRVYVKGNLDLWGANIRENSTSGGFIADVKVDGAVSSGTQQQFLTRNSHFGSWSGGVWNMAFVGVEGNNIPDNKWLGAGSNFTNIPLSGAMREKPFLTYDEELGYSVFVPDATENTRGISWGGTAMPSGSYLPLDEFYVARSDRDTAKTINAALSAGKNLILTAGIYELDAPLEIGRNSTVVLGLGLATLRASDKNTDTLMRVSAVNNVCIGGLLFDAGKHTETLLEVGSSAKETANASTPVTLSDLFFRVGGWTQSAVSVKTCVVIDADHVIGDNLWIWRADHSALRIGNSGLFEGVAWDLNPADTGIIVNGDNATFYGLFVEHFLKYQTVWNGNGGTTYFYQSELPYDVPDRASWSPDGTANGYASYYVSENVKTHTAYALGVYSFLRDAAVTLDSAIVCPQTDGMSFAHIVTVWLSGNADTAVKSIINGTGEEANKGHRVSVLESYAPEK
ncbi:MAG: hypothetical protein K2K80_04905 [Clostridia bacterium]|nr:hypothetical protein [Clostridia bacterium]